MNAEAFTTLVEAKVPAADCANATTPTGRHSALGMMPPGNIIGSVNPDSHPAGTAERGPVNPSRIRVLLGG